MRTYPRKTAPQVVRGIVRKKNRWTPSENRYDAPRPREVVVDRERPGEGYRHVLTKKDVYDFLRLLPDWDKLAVGLNAVVLAEGYGADGWHCPGVVHICAWQNPIWITSPVWYYNAHADIFERLGVECQRAETYLDEKYPDRPEERVLAFADFRALYGWFGSETWLCKFSESSVRAYQLLHILLHELGHHHDRMTTRSQRRASRGETYAEEYARRYEASIWEAYVRTFSLF